MEGMQDQSSEAYKRYVAGSTELGELIGYEALNAIPHAPTLIRDFVAMRDNAASAGRLAKENADLKAQIARMTSPAGGGTGAIHGAPGAGTGNDHRARLRAAFAAAGNRNA